MICDPFEQQHDARPKQQDSGLKATRWAVCQGALQGETVYTIHCPAKVACQVPFEQASYTKAPELLSPQPRTPFQHDYREHAVLATNATLEYVTPADIIALLQLTIPETDSQSAHQAARDSRSSKDHGWRFAFVTRLARTASACRTNS